MSVRGTGGPRGMTLHEVTEKRGIQTCTKCNQIEPDTTKPCPGIIFIGRRRRFETGTDEPAMKQALNPVRQ